MAKQTWNNPIDKNVDWGGDASTDGLPVSGQQVQKFIKDSLDKKASIFYHDVANNRYLVFADEETKNAYVDDPTRVDLILGNFDAPFNYTAEINLATSAYNAIYLGETGNYIDFTFDIKNKQDVSTMENVVITYTIMRNATKQVFSQVAKHGDIIHTNIDKYLGEGVNTIIIGISGQTSLAATTVAVTYNVVNLQIEDETDITIAYDLSSDSKILETGVTVKGTGIKTVEWYLDGQKLDFVKNEDEIVEAEGYRPKNIELANLQQGRHSLQVRACTNINGDLFYTPTLYRDIMVYTGADNNTITAISMEIPSKYGIITESPILYGLTQYIPYSLKFATYSPTNKEKVSVAISLDGARLGIVDSKNGIINEFTVVSKTAGSKTLILAEEDSEYAIPMVVEATTMKIEEITSGLALDFYSVGMNGNAWSFGDYTGTFSGFNWNATSGWVDNRLRINAGASFSIDYAPLAGKPTDKGKTLEFEFKTTNVNDDNAIICDLRNSNGVGLLITATKITLTSENGVVLQNEFKANEEVRVAVVINRSTASTRKCLSLFYANGSVSRCNNWDVTDGYESDAQITFVGSLGAEVELKAIRIYDLALTDDQILNNYTLYRDNVSEMLDVYERNDIYAEGSTSFSPDKMVSRLPVMIVTGDIPTLENTSDKDTQIIVDIEYTNLQEPSRSFKMTGAAMRPQGTSSMGYPKKNFRIYTNKVGDTILYDSNGNIVSDNLYSFKEGAIPVDCWCLKADYAESSGTHNTGIARMWNKALYNMQIDGQYVCRTDAQKAALAAGYPYDVRTTIDGFPILLFYRQSASDEPIFIGKYNFNNDKSTEKVFGFTDIEGFNNERMQCWEVLNNGNSIGLFTDVSDFYNNVTVDGETKKGWEFAFESRYPDTKTPATDDLYNFATWLNGVNGDAERFAIEKWEHFKVYPLAAYYCYIMRHAAADQLVKNAMLTSEDGTHFYFIQYDNDTINGLINTGVIDILPTDNRESKNESGEYKFAGHSSVLWNMLEADTEFMQIVKTVDNALYSAGVSYNECVRIFDEEQANKWVERVYNQDAEYKYVGPYVNAGINNLDMLQGKRDLHRRWWLSKRFSIYDAKFVSGEYKSQAIELKCLNDTPAGQQFSIKAGYPLDYGYGINNLPRETGVTLGVGETKEFTTAEVVNRGDPIRIYGAPNIAEVDLSKISSRLAVVNIANVNTTALGTRLEKLILGGEGVNNIEVSEISGLKQATKLKYLDVRGMRGINSIDLSSHPYFEELKAIGSEVAAVSFTKGAPVNRLELPATMKVLNLEQLPYLTAENLVLENIANIHTISIKNCPKLSNSFDWVYRWYTANSTSVKDCSLTMDNVDWAGVAPDQLIALKNLGTLNLKGKVEISEVNEEIVNQLIEVFGDTAFSNKSDFYIIAPPAVFLSGRTELLEGESEKYICVAFGGEVLRTTFSIVSGANQYVSIDQQTGLLTTTEGMGNENLTLRVTVITSEGTMTKDMVINVRARQYPSQSQTSIAGANRLEKTKETYTLAYSVAGITGDMIAEWTLEGMDDFVVIDSYTDNSCVLKTLKQATVLKGTLSCKLTKRYNNASLFTISREINLVDDTIAEVDPGICQALYDAGLTASPTVVTKDEARLITGDDLQPGTSASTSVFAQQSNIESFDGFKWFTGVTKIPKYCFADCIFLKSINIPEGITYIDERAFSGCARLGPTITLPETLEVIGDYAFYNCKNISTIICKSPCVWLLSPSTFTNVGYNTASSGINTIYVPQNAIAFDYERWKKLYSDCKFTLSKTLPSSNDDRIECDSAFCKALQQAGLIKSQYSARKSEVEVITKEQLINSSGGSIFKSLSIKEISGFQYFTSLIEIPQNCFENSYVTSVTLPSNITKIGNSAFYGCRNLNSIELPESVEVIGESAFYRTGIKVFNIPKNVKVIERQALFSTDQINYYPVLKEINVDEQNENFCVHNGVLFTKDMKTLVQYPGASALEEYTVPSDVKNIGSSALYGCNNLKKLFLNEGLYELSHFAIGNCKALTDIYLPSTLRVSGQTGECSKLTNIHVSDPANIYKMPAYVYSLFNNVEKVLCNDEEVTEVVLPEGINITIDGNWWRTFRFEKVTLPSSYTIQDSTSTIHRTSAMGCRSLEISNLTTFINVYGLFSKYGTILLNGEPLTELVIPQEVKIIPNRKFQGAEGILSVDIHEDVYSIGSDAFSNCKNLQTIILRSSAGLYSSQFSGCVNVKTIISYSKTAPTTNASSYTFGALTSNYVGRNSYNTGENILYVPADSTGYNSRQWLDPLQNPEKCGFTLSATL